MHAQNGEYWAHFSSLTLIREPGYKANCMLDDTERLCGSSAGSVKGLSLPRIPSSGATFYNDRLPEYPDSCADVYTICLRGHSFRRTKTVFIRMTMNSCQDTSEGTFFLVGSVI